MYSAWHKYFAHISLLNPQNRSLDYDGSGRERNMQSNLVILTGPLKYPPPKGDPVNRIMDGMR